MTNNLKKKFATRHFADLKDFFPKQKLVINDPKTICPLFARKLSAKFPNQLIPFQRTLKTMKHISLFALTAASFCAGDRASKGWQINCKVDTSDEFGPAFLDSNRRQHGDLGLYWSWFGRGEAGISGSSPFGVPGDFDDCSSTGNDTTLMVKADFITWPNEVNEVPPSVFGTGYIAIPTGFATPATNDGCIAIADLNAPSGYPVGADNIQLITGGCGTGGVREAKYFYHVAKWFDMDQDGDLDLLTARAEGRTNPTDLSSSDLVWFQNPGNGVFQPGNNPWQEFVVQTGADVADTYLDVFNNNGTIVVIAGGFSSRQLVLFQGNDWTNVFSVTAELIDTDGYYFYQEFADLNLDGIEDVIVTIGSYGEQNGQLIVYQGQMSSQGVYSLAPKSVVYDQFPMWSSAALGSPGEARPFFYSILDKKNGNVKPNLLVSGDDDGNMYLFTPGVSGNFGDYDFNQIYESAPFNPFVTPFTAPTVGKPAVIDINEDGCNEIVIANYHNKQLVIIEQNSQSNCKKNAN